MATDLDNDQQKVGRLLLKTTESVSGISNTTVSQEKKVGARALSVALSVASTSIETNAKPPKKMHVLDEEKYLDDLEHIIVRDYFPDLPHLEVEAAYEDALSRNDREALRRCLLKKQEKLLPDSPASFETPHSKRKEQYQKEDTVEEPTCNPEKPVKPEDKNLPLDKYLNKNTSEDNAAFVEMLDEAEKRRRLKDSWLYKQEIEQQEKAVNYLALPTIEQQAIDGPKTHTLDTWTYRAKNAVMYVPDGVPLSAIEKVEAATDRQIDSSKTRFSRQSVQVDQESIDRARHSRNVLLRGKVGADGKEILPSATPRVGGYGFIATPSPAPGVGESPMMTWGEIESTPQRLREATPGPHFKVPPAPERERIAHKLAENAAQAQRDKKAKAIEQMKAQLSSPSPGSSKAERLTQLSPAAKLLAASKLRLRGMSTPGSTPSPSPRRSTPVLKSVVTPTQKTPTSKRDGDSMTDNLLSLPKRSKATDFF